MERNVLPLNEIKKRILKLSDFENSLSKQKVYDQFVFEYSKLVTHNEYIPFVVFKFNQTNFKDMRFYRVTAFENLQKENLNHFSYPPHDLAVSGRCNLPKFPVFYSSDYGITSILEFIKAHPKQINDELYLSEWSMSRSYEWMMLLIVFSGLHKSNPGLLLGNDLSFMAIRTLLHIIPPQKILSYINFYHKAFTSSDHRFSSINSHFFLNTDNHDVILYPSVANQKKDLNQAINTKLVDNELIVLKRVFLIKLNETNINKLSDRTKWNLIAVADRKRDSLKWRLPTTKDFQKAFDAIDPYEA